MNRKFMVLVAAAGLVLSGCTATGTVSCVQGSDGVVTCKATPSASPSTEPTPSQTVTPSQTPSSTPAPTTTQTSSPVPSASATPSPTGTPTSTATPTGSLSSLARVPWAGGNSYWAKFPGAGKLSDPNIFPVSVFFGKPEHAAQLKDIGVNVYQEAEHDGSTMKSITDTGMLVVAGQEWTRAEVGTNPGVVGWATYDECDMGAGCSGSNTQQNLDQMKQLVNKIRAYNDGRPIMANYSKGILGTWWANGTMSEFLSVVDFASADNYAYTSPPVGDAFKQSSFWPTGANPATSAAYGWQADRMRAYQSPAGAHPNWVFVESARPYLSESNAKTITPQQFEGAIWSSIIHGAEGISIFQHNNDPKYGNYSLVDIPADRKAALKTVLTGVQALAPVLNTQSYVWNAGAAGMDTMLKAKDGSAYLFAGVGLKGTTGSKTFSLPAEVRGATVEVVGENRTLPVSGGKFTDSFANEYTHHVYKITI